VIGNAAARPWAACAYLLLHRSRRGGVLVDVDLPAGEAGGQARVLAFFADREGELIFVDGDLDALLLGIEHQVLHLRRLERLEDVLLRIGAPADDVDLLVVELAHDVLHA
jgi:hypothetical protein